MLFHHFISFSQAFSFSVKATAHYQKSNTTLKSLAYEGSALVFFFFPTNTGASVASQKSEIILLPGRLRVR